MPESKPIYISYDLQCSPDPCIKIFNNSLESGGGTRVSEKGSIMFFSGLGPGVDTKIQFFASKADKNSTPPAPISGFCHEEAGAEFIVNNYTQCSIKTKVTTSTPFFYSVEATDFNVLDPVIIIEPGTAPVNFVSPVLSVLVLVLVSGAAFFVGKSLRK